MEPFKGMVSMQVIRAVADKGRRPEIPKGASASPDVARLMGRCWKQDPAQRPEGFLPVVQELGRLVKRAGDPRHRQSAADDVTSSSGVKHSGGGAASVAASTAPLTAGDSLHASPLHTMSVMWPMAATAVPPPAPSAQDAATDRAALVVFFNATGGPSWKNGAGWGTSAPLGKWHGVTVDGGGRVVGLDLRDNNLNGACRVLEILVVLASRHNRATGYCCGNVFPAVLLDRLCLCCLHCQRHGLHAQNPPYTTVVSVNGAGTYFFFPGVTVVGMSLLGGGDAASAVL